MKKEVRFAFHNFFNGCIIKLKQIIGHKVENIFVSKPKKLEGMTVMTTEIRLAWTLF
jgi:hypothetical protein